MKKIKLILETGEEFVGESIGHEIDGAHSLGELVFNTSMTGYQEIISDPSYCDQMVVMTYPLIGNYGVNKDDFESLTPALKGLVVRECPPEGSNWRNEYSLRDLLKRFKIPGIAGLDTRELTKKIREKGVMKAVLVPESFSAAEAKPLLEKSLGNDQIARVSIKNPIHFPGEGKRIVLMDFGYKKNILRSLMRRNCDVVVVPWNATTEMIQSYRPQGILLSNGPGDPKDVPGVLPVIRDLQKMYPMFCICMGHQLFALANGADTEKLKFGHRGGNHPVKDLNLGKVFMSSQNHGYAVTVSSVEKSNLEISQININDNTVEGLRHKTLPAFSVQYHPEACPGPEDTGWLFDDFLASIRK
ncbi:carbamoyl phosphate synthase small subunit [Peredibacter sp. HCB2-198]|uniref:carbamoyl phosphate synthase small subunit n=1 Tax=Peredibacter sp. HCB2-198 TaxID=3383025 RepID=UPI0038B65143